MAETAQEREDRILAEAAAKPLVAKWCDCADEQEFRCYPADGVCKCGIYKHHVHGECGHVLQTG